MRDALSGLTLRGRSFIAAAVACALSAFLLGEKDLIHIALVLFALPVLAVIMVSRAKYQMTCTRVLTPHRTPVGTHVHVELVLENLSRVPSDTLLIEERLPPELGPYPRVVLERLRGRTTSTISYSLQPPHRGHFPIGPLFIQVSDPFRMCTLTHYFPSNDHLTVIPPITPLPELSVMGEYAGSRETRARSVAVHGHDDTATREYREGDDLRRVHWRSTARIGELMVRREEQPWEPQATVVIDSRSCAHFGTGPDASFEWLVSAAASVCMHLRGGQYKLRLLSDTGIDIESSEFAGEDALLTYLAGAQLGPRSDMDRLTQRLGRRIDEGLVIAFLGQISLEEVHILNGLGRKGSPRVAFLLQPGAWKAAGTAQQVTSTQQASKAQQTAALALVNSGWRVIAVKPQDTIAALWPQAAQRSQGFAYRAALAETITRTARP